jgi:hypothetical protein
VSYDRFSEMRVTIKILIAKRMDQDSVRPRMMQRVRARRDMAEVRTTGIVLVERRADVQVGGGFIPLGIGDRSVIDVIGLVRYRNE